MKSARFPTEKAMQEWLEEQLSLLSPKIKCYRQVETFDMFDNGGFVDFVITGEVDDRPFSVAIECKKDFGVSRNTAEGCHQAYHYREFSVLYDKRIPSELRYHSPNLSFAGLLVEGDHQHTQRIKGMEILLLKFGVGIAHLTNWRDQIVLSMGETKLLRLDGCFADWHPAAANYLFGTRKRAGTRRDNTTLADRHFEFIQ